MAAEKLQMGLSRLNANPRVLAAMQKARIHSLQDALLLSRAELSRRSKTSERDAEDLLQAVAATLYPAHPVSAAAMPLATGLSFGCATLDAALGKALLTKHITELAGESAVGKTQFCLQLSLMCQLPRCAGGLGGDAVFVCTEDAFPHQRLMQMVGPFKAKHGAHLRGRDPGRAILVEHSDSVEDLWNIISLRLARVLAAGNVKLVIIDSIAALFRVEYGVHEASSKAQALFAFGSKLKALANDHDCAVLCINQVSDYFGPEDSGRQRQVIPALGLAWSNVVNTRLFCRRVRDDRTIHITTSPHLGPRSCPYTINDAGVSGIPERQ